VRAHSILYSTYCILHIPREQLTSASFAKAVLGAEIGVDNFVFHLYLGDLVRGKLVGYLLVDRPPLLRWLSRLVPHHGQ
jgi:hypothetical protein